MHGFCNLLEKKRVPAITSFQTSEKPEIVPVLPSLIITKALSAYHAMIETISSPRTATIVIVQALCALYTAI